MSQVVLVMLLAARCTSFGQILPFQSYTTKDGVPSNQINAVYQDSCGFLWIGTDNGLSVYDGTTFTNYSTADGLSNNWITCITESRTAPGTMWIGTVAGGVNKYSAGTFTNILPGTNPSANNVVALVEDQHGTLWCATENGVYKIQGEKITPVPNSIARRADTAVINTRDDQVWCSVDRMILVHTPGDPKPKTIAPDLDQQATITALAVDRDGEVWAGTSDGTVLQFRDTVVVQQRKITSGFIFSLLEDEHGYIWIRVPDGLAKIAKGGLANGQATHYAIAGKMWTNNLPGPILLDRENNLWIGSLTEGLLKMADRSFCSISLPYPDQGLSAVTDSSGHIWVSSRSGVYEIFRDEGENWQKFEHRLDYRTSNAPVYPGLCDPQGRLWVWLAADSAINGYVITSRRGQPSTLTPVKRLIQGRHFPKDPLVSFYVDRQNRAWLGLDYVDVAVIDLNSLQIVDIFKQDNAAPGHSIRKIYQDRNGNVWLGDFVGGLSALYAGQEYSQGFNKFTTAEGLPDNAIRSIHQDRDGRLWIGTRHGGLALYENGRFRSVSMKDGLRSNAIWWIADDDRDRLWLNTDVGFELLDRKTLRILPQRSELLTEKIYACGLYRDEFLWFVTKSGLTIYEYSRSALNRLPPPVYITRFVVNGNTVSLDQGVNLSHLQNNCTIEFVGISLKDEKAVRYQYRLKGMDADWSAPTDHHEVAYAALPPGNYHFEILAINGDGVKSAQPAVLHFTILPPFWQRWWFIAGVALLVAGSFGGVVRYVSIQKLQRRVQTLVREQAIQQERSRTRDVIARDLHDDVASTLGSIALYIETLKRQLRETAPGAYELLEKINNLALAAEEAMGDIVWSAAPQHDTLPDLLTRMRDVGTELCSTHDIECHLHLPEPVAPIQLPDEVRKNLYLIFKEGLTNAVRHARAKTITIQTVLNEGVLHLSIVDDGRGFSANLQPGGSAPARGHGLRNMKKRAEEIGAEFSLQSTPGKGTVLSLSLKMT